MEPADLDMRIFYRPSLFKSQTVPFP